jgi:signal transduction histidine kinase
MDVQQLLCELDLISTLEALGTGAMVLNRGAQLVAMNRQALDMIGFGSLAEAIDEHEGRTHRLRIMRLDGLPLDPHALINRVLAGATIVEDFERLALDGSPQLIVRVNASPLLGRNEQIVGVIKLLREVTAEYELRKRRDEFVRVATHELRTPTTVLRLHAQRLLRAQPASAPPLRASIEAVDRATRRIETLAIKLQDIAIIAAGEAIPIKPSSFRLDVLVADVVHSLQPEHTARVHTNTAPAQVTADATRLREVIEALLDNALRYSEAPATVEVDVRPRDGQVEISVADHGIGIPEARQRHVFEQFYRAHVDTPLDRGGLGASLYLAAQIMKLHGGRIWFESKDGQGSTFHLALRAKAP